MNFKNQGLSFNLKQDNMDVSFIYLFFPQDIKAKNKERGKKVPLKVREHAV